LFPGETHFKSFLRKVFTVIKIGLKPQIEYFFIVYLTPYNAIKSLFMYLIRDAPLLKYFLPTFTVILMVIPGSIFIAGINSISDEPSHDLSGRVTSYH